MVSALRSLGLKVASQYVNVLVPRPSEDVVHKWQLMCVGDEAHVLWHNLEEFIDGTKRDIKASNVRPSMGYKRVEGVYINQDLHG